MENDCRRFQELYEAMNDRKLEEMADRIGDLTEAAQQVLRAEMVRRGLDKKAPPVSYGEPIQFRDQLTGIWAAKDAEEGQAAVELLESAGIPAYLGTTQIELVDGGFEEELEIRVLPEFIQRANELLGERFPREPEEEPEEANDYAGTCPQCGSQEIVMRGLEPDAAPGPQGTDKYLWSCDACGHSWKDAGIEKGA